jgi:Flp pilus assembly protein TadG
MLSRPDPAIRRARGLRPGRARRFPGRAGDESGQALVEFVLVLPVVALVMGVAFNGWNAMQLSIRLTTAARAGAIQAANDLAANPAQTQAALAAATAAVNAEEGDTNVYQDTNSAAQDYVSMSTSSTTTSGGVTINMVTITISQTSATLVPIVANLPVNAHATARYS